MRLLYSSTLTRATVVLAHSLELARIERERQQLAEQTRSPRSNAGSPAPPKAAQPPPPQQQQTRQNEPQSPPPRRQARRFTFEGRDTGMGDAASSVGAGGGGGGGGNLYNPAPPRPSAGAGAGAAGINMHALAGQPFSLPQASAGTAAAMGYGPGMGMASPMIAGAPGLGLDALARLKRVRVQPWCPHTPGRHTNTVPTGVGRANG